MRKMTGFVFTFLLFCPAFVHAWTLTGTVLGPGGSGQITVTNATPVKTITGGTGYATISGSAAANVTVTPTSPGYSLSRVLIDSVAQTNPDGTPKTGPFTIPYNNTSHSIQVTFAAVSYTVSVAPSAGGTVSIQQTAPTVSGSSTTSLSGIKTGATIKVTATPSTDYRVVSITIGNNPPTPYSGGGGAAQTQYFSPTANTTVTAAYQLVPNYSIVMTFPGTSIAGTGVTVDATGTTSNDTGLMYAYMVKDSGNNIRFSRAANASPVFTFTPAVVDTYTITLTVTSTSNSTGVTRSASLNVLSAVGNANLACTPCHSQGGSAVVAQYNASPHFDKKSCPDCHTSAPHGSPVNVMLCVNCHTPEAQAWQQSPHATNPNQQVICVTCHADHTVAVNHSTCVTCHSTATPQVVASYQGSRHATNPARVVLCKDCHTTHAAKTSFDICLTCHASFPASLAWHSGITTNYCQNCHNPHVPENISIGYPHFSNFTTAQYFTKNISCDSCHFNSVGKFNVYSANHQWAKSGHGNPLSPAYIGRGPYTEASLEAYDFKFLGTPLPAKPATTTSQDCVRCHTTTGFIGYVTPTDPADPATAFSNIHAWGTPGDRTREMVACNACHNNTTGFDAAFGRRSVGIETDPVFNPGVYNVAAWYGYSSAATKKIVRPKAFENPAGVDMVDSNICIACHSGKAAGDLIKAIATKLGTNVVFWQSADFIDPHGMGAASIMFPDGVRAGYEYRTGTSASSFHTNIGLDDNQGPCVGCHMSSPKKHTFTALSTASNGVIAAITSPLCADCHGVIALPMDAGTLQAKKEGYQAALAVVAAQLAAKGIYFNASASPYFFTTADPAQQTSAHRTVNWNYNSTFKGANLMGAAFNLRLLQSDAGAWLHNSAYTKRLLHDTIDYLDDGSQNNSVSVTIQNLGIDHAIKERAAAYVIPRI